jgi:hypothetical protein
MQISICNNGDGSIFIGIQIEPSLIFPQGRSAADAWHWNQTNFDTKAKIVAIVYLTRYT